MIHRPTTVGMDFAAEAALLRPLPAEPFQAGLSLTPRVDWYGRSASVATFGTGTRWVRRNRPPSPSTPPFSCAPPIPGWQ